MKFIFLLCILLQIYSYELAAQSYISSKVILANGDCSDITHPFLDEEDPTFSLSDKKEVYWKAALWCNDEKKELKEFYKPQYPTRYFTLPIHASLFSKEAWRYTLPNDSSVYYKGVIYAINANGKIEDSIQVSFNVLPSIPKVKDIHLSYTYNWEYDCFDNSGILEFTASSSRTSNYSIGVIFSLTSHAGEFFYTFPDDPFVEEFIGEESSSLTRVPICFEVSKMRLKDCEWGQYYLFFASNKYGGVTCKDTIFTTDYITDKIILNRINELRKEETSIHQIELEERMIYNENCLRILGQAANISIFSVNGCLVKKYSNVSSIDISAYPKGVYIIKAIFNNKITITKKIIKK